MNAELAIVFTTEVMRRMRSRIFWLASLGGALAIALVIEAPTLFVSVARASSGNVVLAGPASLRARATPFLERGRAYRVVASVDALPPRVTTAYLDANGHAGAALALSLRARRLHVDVYPRDLSAFDGAEFPALVPLNIELATRVPAARIRDATTIARTVHPLDGRFASTRQAAVGHGLAYGLIFLLYLTIVLASQSVMSAVAEEKTSRIAEILVATIAPANLLAGKTFAAAAVAIVQLVVWIATAALILPHALGSLAATAGSARPSPAASLVGAAIEPGVFVAFAAFFVLGYLQYATVYAAAASLISRTEDLGIVTAPVLAPVVLAFVVAQFALLAPNAPLVVASSFVPFLSPFVMFTRIAIAIVPAWQVALAVAIDVATVLAAFFAAGRVYRVGMLLYGRLPSPRQILLALRS